MRRRSHSSRTVGLAATRLPIRGLCCANPRLLSERRVATRGMSGGFKGKVNNTRLTPPYVAIYPAYAVKTWLMIFIGLPARSIHPIFKNRSF
jgi:hypothetical protein